VYGHPKLFSIGENLREHRRFRTFTGKDGASFRLTHDGTESAVISETPFSLLGKIDFLKTAGWRRFIIDFTSMPLKKTFYKNIINAAVTGKDTGGSRFNWKDGFWQQAEAAGSSNSANLQHPVKPE
jgi:putative protease